MQVTTESRQIPLVSSLHHVFSALQVADDQQTTQHSGSGSFLNARTVLITGGTFVSLSYGLVSMIQH
jgi:hypothetical protein